MASTMENEKKLISSIVSSVKSSLEGSEVDEETLKKLEMLWIKKLQKLDSEDEKQFEDGEIDMRDGYVEDDVAKPPKAASIKKDKAIKVDDVPKIENSDIDEKEKEADAEDGFVPQLDGHAESSDSDVSNNDDDDDDDDVDSDSEFDTDDEEKLDGEIGIEMDPPCSADDVSDEEASEVFDTENVVVCQYEKISRSRNRWKVVLKDGVMTLNGRDYAFHKACGEVDW